MVVHKQKENMYLCINLKIVMKSQKACPWDQKNLFMKRKDHINVFIVIKNLKILFLNIKFIYSETATKFWEIFILLLFYIVVPVKSKVKILQNFVAFSKYMKFTNIIGSW